MNPSSGRHFDFWIVVTNVNAFPHLHMFHNSKARGLASALDARVASVRISLKSSRDGSH